MKFIRAFDLLTLKYLRENIDKSALQIMIK